MPFPCLVSLLYGACSLLSSCLPGLLHCPPSSRVPLSHLIAAAVLSPPARQEELTDNDAGLSGLLDTELLPGCRQAPRSPAPSGSVRARDKTLLRARATVSEAEGTANALGRPQVAPETFWSPFRSQPFRGTRRPSPEPGAARGAFGRRRIWSCAQGLGAAPRPGRSS